VSRRREDRVISCLACGDTLGIYVEGERTPDIAHHCLTHDALDRDLNEAADMLAEMKATRKPEE
jgi:hypothetical protein